MLFGGAMSWEQEELPLMPKKPQRVHITEIPDSQKVVERYEALRGKQVYGKTVMQKQAKDMLEHYSLEEVRGCIEWLHNEYPPEYNFSLAHVAKRLPDYRRKRDSETVKVRTIEMPEGWKRGNGGKLSEKD